MENEIKNSDLADWCERIAKAENVGLSNENRGHLLVAADRIRTFGDLLEAASISMKMCADENHELRMKLKETEPALQMAADRLCAKCTIFNGEKCGHDINHVDCIGGKVRRTLVDIQKENSK